MDNNKSIDNNINVYSSIWNIANISTDGMPQIVFYMLGTTVWTYFSSCLTKHHQHLQQMQNIWESILPKISNPISTVISGLINFGVQF